jgi:segregation and condensation protein A
VSYEVALEQFSGPLQLLLDLIEQEKLPITEVSLAKVTEGYLKHLNEHVVPPEELADFLVVATKLLLIKSRAILPQLQVEEEEDASQLADQLRMYKRFVEAAEKIESLYAAGRVMFGREKAVLPKERQFAPPQSVTTTVLRETFRSVLKRLEPFFALRQASLERVVSVQERMKQLQDAFVAKSKMMFRDVVGGAKSKVEVVVSFLALLELMKQRVVKAVQGSAFQDIILTRSD